MIAAKARKYGAILGVSLRSGLMYRGNVLGGLLFYALFIFVSQPVEYRTGRRCWLPCPR